MRFRRILNSPGDSRFEGVVWEFSQERNRAHFCRDNHLIIIFKILTIQACQEILGLIMIKTVVRSHSQKDTLINS